MQLGWRNLRQRFITVSANILDKVSARKSGVEVGVARECDH
jgi:hypothetical protein